MQKHLSDCSSHYACLCVIQRGEKRYRAKKDGLESGSIECLHLFLAVRSMSSNKGFGE